MNRSNNIPEISGWKEFLHNKGIGKTEEKYYFMCLLGLAKQVEYLVRINRKLFIMKITVDWLGGVGVHKYTTNLFVGQRIETLTITMHIFISKSRFIIDYSSLCCESDSFGVE